MEFIKVKHKRRTALEWYELVKQWQASGESQKSFCDTHGIYCAKTFSRWVCDYRQFFNMPAVEEQHVSSTPLLVAPSPSITEKSSNQCAELRTEDFSLKVPLSATEAEWKKIFSSLGACR
ncbi:MAG: hypothetical protein HN802_04655 [Candidatus Jacksonbacteria bacterium]|nr:hypothetical protein [Candidatus Jacksonbacteria bacterium]MBT7338963.1 hypothetical protein [Candidatus Jacksonbacteria bacterium]